MISILLAAMTVCGAEMPKADASDIALQPQQNEYRNVLSLSGVWNFRTDEQAVGVRQQWFAGLTGGSPIAVPGSWNDQKEGLHNYLGRVWYERETFVPLAWKTERVVLRIGSANYQAKVTCHSPSTSAVW